MTPLLRSGRFRITPALGATRSAAGSSRPGRACPCRPSTRGQRFHGTCDRTQACRRRPWNLLRCAPVLPSIGLQQE